MKLVKTLVLVITFLIFFVFFLRGSSALGRAEAGPGLENMGFTLSLSSPYPEDPPSGGAVVWYLGHCGYAVRTQNHLLVFDYQEQRDGRQPKSKPARPALDTGWIDPAEIKDLKVRVFVSHSHRDHFDSVIFTWKSAVPDIAYYFGWKAADDPSYNYLVGPRAELKSGDLDIATINSHHSGVPEVAWLVKVDGLVIYHNGDCRPDDPSAEYDFLKTKTKSIDLAFVFPVYEEGQQYAIQNVNFFTKFLVKAAFPTHAQAGDAMYLGFQKAFQAKFPHLPIHVPLKTGQKFVLSEFPKLTGPYLGQKAPGTTPEIFAPGIVSTREDEAMAVFSPDGKELFYSKKMGPEKRLTIMTSRDENGAWTPPQIASFSGKYYDAVTSISPDGHSLYFASLRQQADDESPFDFQNIWVIIKKEGKWRNPRMLPPPVNSAARELGGYLSKDGYFYFSTSREGSVSGQCRARVVNGKFTQVESINHLYNFNMPCIEIARDPDDKFLVFVSYDQADGFGGFDLYASFKNGHDSWTTPKNLGDRINTPANEHFPTFSPDGQYLFFVSDRIPDKFKNNDKWDKNSDIYWVSAKIIEELRPKDEEE